MKEFIVVYDGHETTLERLKLLQPSSVYPAMENPKTFADAKRDAILYCRQNIRLFVECIKEIKKLKEADL